MKQGPRFTHRAEPHADGRERHVLRYSGPNGVGVLRWVHVSDDEAWVTEWAVRPQGRGVGSALMDVLTGTTTVDGVSLPPYRWFSALPGNWEEPFRRWARTRPHITHKPRLIESTRRRTGE